MSDQLRANVGASVKTLLDEYAGLERKIAQQMARDEQRAARDMVAARKADTRCKIIVGGAILALARENAEVGEKLRSALLSRVSDPRDRALLCERLGWPLEQPGLPNFETAEATEGKGSQAKAEWSAADRPKSVQRIYADLLDVLPTLPA